MSGSFLTCAEFNANEENLLFSLIGIRFGKSREMLCDLKETQHYAKIAPFLETNYQMLI